MLSDLVAKREQGLTSDLEWPGERSFIVDDLFGFYRVANIESCLKMHLQ